jgi:hypothetical protein
MDSDTITRIAESQILEAIEDGKFDNLPGKGKPIVLDDDLSIPLHIRMANKVLKNAGVVPEWVQFRKDILDERTAVKGTFSRLIRENTQRKHKLISISLPSDHPRILAYAQWHRKSRESYHSMLKSVNTSILKFCINAPGSVSGKEAFAPYRIEFEMSRFDEQFQPLEDMPHPPVDKPINEGMLRAAARSKYVASEKRKA